MAQPLNPNDFEAFTSALEPTAGLTDLVTDFDFDYVTSALEPPAQLDASIVVAIAKNSTDTATLSEVVLSFSATLTSSDRIRLGDRSGGVPTIVDKVTTAESLPTSGGLNYVVTLPAYIAGDVVVVGINVESASIGVTDASATGWTEVGSRATNQYSAIAMVKVMDGTEGSTVTFTLSKQALNAAAGAISYRGVDNTTPVEGSASTGATSNPNGFTTADLVTVNPSDMGVLFVQGGASGTITSSPTGANREWSFNGAGSSRLSQLADVGVENTGTTVHFINTYTLGIDAAWMFFLLKGGAPTSGGITIDVILAASDSATLTEPSNTVTTPTVTAKSSSDSATETDTDQVPQSRSDNEFFGLTESESAPTVVPTAKSSSDSAALSEAQSVTTPVTPTSSDTFTLTESALVTVPTLVPLQDNDVTALGTETSSLTAAFTSTDSVTLSQDDGGTPGGGGAGDGGGTGSGGGPGIVVTTGRKHTHHPKQHGGISIPGSGADRGGDGIPGDGGSSGSGGGGTSGPPASGGGGPPPVTPSVLTAAFTTSDG